MDTARKQMSDTALARSKIYGLLATLFRAEPTDAFLRELQGPDFSRVFFELGIDLGSELQKKSEAELREDLAVEYTRLFLGPGPHISAHESVFVEADGGVGGLWGEKTVAVKKFIEAAGLTYGSEYTGIPDHVSVELEFLQKLVEWEGEKWAESDSESAVYCLGVEKRFVEEHLGRWLPELCDKVAARAELPFYREMAGLAKKFLEHEQRTIGDYALPDRGRES
jgi:TorA maturation chaperone TorD